MLRRILILTMLFAVVTACSKSDTDKSGHSYALLQKDVPGVYENENSLFIYDNDLYQYTPTTPAGTVSGYRIPPKAVSWRACWKRPPWSTDTSR